MRAVPDRIASSLRQVAPELIVEHQAPSVDAVASASGISRATLYYHFSGKAELLDYMLTDLLAHAAVGVAAASDGDGDVFERLDATLNAIIDFVAANRGLAGAMLAVLADPGHYADVAADADQQLGSPVRDLLVAGNADGSFDVADPDVAMIAILGATIVTASAFIDASAETTSDSTRKRLVRQMIDGIRGD